MFLLGIKESMQSQTDKIVLKFVGRFMASHISKSLIIFFLIFASSSVKAQDISDPLEGFNRGIFWFNDKLDVYVMEPVARGYDYITPQPVQKGIGNFFENLRYPKYLVSDLVQFKFAQAAEHTGRFIVNSTIGLVGLVDVAKQIGLEQHEEDFGLALAYYGVPPGPYLVLPLLGPSNVRDGIGRVVDSFLDPIGWVSYTSLDSDSKLAIILGTKSLDFIDQRAGLIEAIETAKESSVDYYLFLQGAYYQHRRGVLYDGNPPEEEEPQEVE